MNINSEHFSERQKDNAYQMSAQVLQPWSTPVLKASIPREILARMIEVSDGLLANRQSVSNGDNLVGQIATEVKLPLEALEEIGALRFFENMVREFVIICKCQEHPFKNDIVRAASWNVELTSCWIVSQQPNEYNPVHSHHMHVSAVMYLKVPKMRPSRKSSRDMDGSIEFIGVGSRDRRLSTSQFHVAPAIGDLYLFGAGQLHTVYPYRCFSGEEDTERRSVSFNATFQQG
jgi:hypothetical protein